CWLAQADTVLPHEIDHIRSQKHGGESTLENLCLACSVCNAYKGPNVAGYDPETDELVRLFHPRLDSWGVHFQWVGAELVGRTPEARATIFVLAINSPERIEHRRLLIELGRFPE
ncbi:MAG: HNH endonuclease signature motif containing protein, partial [Planctomycetota bacterium]